MMDDMLFNIIALSATTCFVLGLVEGFLPLILIALATIGLLYWLAKKIK